MPYNCYLGTPEGCFTPFSPNHLNGTNSFTFLVSLIFCRGILILRLGPALTKVAFLVFGTSSYNQRSGSKTKAALLLTVKISDKYVDPDLGLMDMTRTFSIGLLIWNAFVGEGTLPLPSSMLSPKVVFVSLSCLESCQMVRRATKLAPTRTLFINLIFISVNGTFRLNLSYKRCLDDPNTCDFANYHF